MPKLKKLLRKKEKWVIFFVFSALVVPILIPLFHKGFFPTHDFIYLARVKAMYEALSDGQFPVRWVDIFRYGDPTYNFYAPLPYYFGALIKFLGLGYIQIVKILFGLGFILSGISMYFLGKRLTDRWGGLLSAALYLYAPYRSVDVYVRGAFSEAWVFIFFPLIFLFSYRLILDKSNRNIIYLALSLAGLFLTHNITTMMFMPFFLGWVITLVLIEKDIKSLAKTFASIILGLGLSAFYFLPALMEKKFVQTSFLTQGYFDFRAHFVALKQFFIPHWDYGASLWGDKDDLSLQLGLVHWLAVTLSGLLLLWEFIKSKFKKIQKEQIFYVALILAFLFALFMQHNKSTIIWKTLTLLEFVQFPWRFMGIAVFFASLVALYIIKLDRFAKIAASGIVALAFLVNIQYFQPQKYYEDSVDAHYVSTEVLARDDKIPKDYLPIWVTKTKSTYEIDPEPLYDKKIVVVDNYRQKSNRLVFSAKATEDSDMVIPVTYFPGWEVYVNDRKVIQEDHTDEGLIKFDLPKGESEVKVLFRNTPVRTISNIISLIALVSLLTMAAVGIKGGLLKK